MLFSRKYTTTMCPEINKPVHLSQTSEECRLRNGCEQKFCPLETEFTPDPIDFRLSMARTTSLG